MLSRAVMSRALLLSRAAPPRLAIRALHKGNDSTPPIRFTSISEKVALYLAIAVSFLSYPTYVLLNLDNLRPRQPNALSDEVQAQIDAIRAARTAAK